MIRKFTPKNPLRYIKMYPRLQTEDICLSALVNSPWAIFYITNQTEQIQHWIVRRAPLYIPELKEPLDSTLELIWNEGFWYQDHIRKISAQFIQKQLDAHPLNIKYLCNHASEEQCIYAIQQCDHAYYCISKPTAAMTNMQKILWII